MKFTCINTSGNIPGEPAYFILHKAGCRDIERTMKGRHVTSFDLEAPDATTCVEQQVADFDDQDMGFTADDFKICPCARKG